VVRVFGNANLSKHFYKKLIDCLEQNLGINLSPVKIVDYEIQKNNLYRLDKQ
jgi:hypothetical protein